MKYDIWVEKWISYDGPVKINLVTGDSSAEFRPVQPEFFPPGKLYKCWEVSAFSKNTAEKIFAEGRKLRLCLELVLVGCVLKICRPRGQMWSISLSLGGQKCCRFHKSGAGAASLQATSSGFWPRRTSKTLLNILSKHLSGVGGTFSHKPLY